MSKAPGNHRLGFAPRQPRIPQEPSLKIARGRHPALPAQTLHALDPCFRLHRKCHDGNLPEIRLPDVPHARARILRRLNRTKPDRKTVDRFVPHQLQYLARFGNARREAPHHEKPARILSYLLPRAYWLPRIMLEQHANAAGSPLFERLHKRAWRHNIPAEVAQPEYACIALE